jgi:hypothetical protein
LPKYLKKKLVLAQVEKFFEIVEYSQVLSLARPFVAHIRRKTNAKK